jgi:hypothetical protein
MRGSTTKVWNINAEETPYMMRLNAKDGRAYTVTQSVNLGQVLSTNVSTVSAFSKSFQISDLAQASSFLSVFDQYRFVKVEAWFSPSGPASIPGYKNGSGRFYSVTDYDDNSNLASENAALQYENVTSTSFSMGHYRCISPPHMAVAAYSGSVFTSFKNVKADWIDSASTTVQHYGFKILASTTNAANDFQVDAFLRYTVQFRNVF